MPSARAPHPAGAALSTLTPAAARGHAPSTRPAREPAVTQPPPRVTRGRDGRRPLDGTVGWTA